MSPDSHAEGRAQDGGARGAASSVDGDAPRPAPGYRRRWLRPDAVRAVRPLARRPVQRVGAVVERREAGVGTKGGEDGGGDERLRPRRAGIGEGVDACAGTARPRGPARSRPRGRWRPGTWPRRLHGRRDERADQPLLSHFLRHYAARRPAAVAHPRHAPRRRRRRRRARGAWPRPDAEGVHSTLARHLHERDQGAARRSRTHLRAHLFAHGVRDARSLNPPTPPPSPPPFSPPAKAWHRDALVAQHLSDDDWCRGGHRRVSQLPGPARVARRGAQRDRPCAGRGALTHAARSARCSAAAPAAAHSAPAPTSARSRRSCTRCRRRLDHGWAHGRPRRRARRSRRGRGAGHARALRQAGRRRGAPTPARTARSRSSSRSGAR